MLIGLDIGGTKIEGIVLDPETYKVVSIYRVPTRQNDYFEFLNSVLSVINHLTDRGEVDAIGIGCCGSIDPISKKMQGANIQVLNGKSFIEDIQRHFDVPIKIANDADCLALSEYHSGAGKASESSCLAVILGTGCGSGIIINGALVTGFNRLGGEIGHNPLPNFDPRIDGEPFECYCGSMNCAEGFVSGTGFSRTYSAKHGHRDAKSIFALIEANEPMAQAHLELYCDQLARLLASVINVIDPEVIVLGGGLSNQEALYPLTQSKLNKYTFTKNVRTQIVRSLHGDSSGVRGAAMLNL